MRGLDLPMVGGAKLTGLSDSYSETSLIGMTIERPDCAEKIVKALKLEDFFTAHTRAAFGAVRDLLEAGSPLDLTEITAQLTAKSVNWDTSQLDLFNWQLNAPIVNDYEITSRVHRLKEKSARRLTYATAKALLEQSEVGDDKEFESSVQSALGTLASTAGTIESTGLANLTIDWDELLSVETPQREMLFDPMIPEGGYIVLYSPPKAGKSLLALEIALTVATGEARMGQALRDPHSVMYFDFENGRSDIRERMEDMGFSQGDPRLPLLRSHFHYLSFPPMDPLDTPKGGADLAVAVEKLRPKLVVIDTAARVVEGEENSSDTYRRFHRHSATLLKRLNIALLMIDHSGKDPGKSVRGTSDKVGAADVVYQLTATGNRIVLNAKAKRINWVADEVKFTKLADPLRHVVDTQPFTSQGIDFANVLDEMGVSLDASRTEIRAHFTNHGLPCKAAKTISDAQRVRRERANRQGKAAFESSEQPTEQPHKNSW